MFESLVVPGASHRHWFPIQLQERFIMPAQRVVAIILVVLGALGVAYGGFSFTKETHQANIGSLHVSVDEKQRVNIPLWVGVGAILIGGIMLLPRRG
jgi:hypothetical protein